MRAEVALAALALGCGSPPLACGDGQAALDLSTAEGAFLYSDEALPVFSLELDLEALQGLARSAQEDPPDVHATLGFDGAEGPESWDVGLHLKGHSSFHPIWEKAAFKIDFQQWDEAQSFHGVRHLTLNNMTGDASMLSEHLTYRVYAWMGLPAARHGYACVRVNGADYGLYGVVETMDAQFLERAFPEPDGNLYEGTQGAEIRPGATEGYQPKVLGDVEDGSDLAELAAALQVPGDTLDTFAAHFDLEELLDAWAVELMIGNVDGYLGRQNNYLLYHQPDCDRWSFLPWGVDENFQETGERDLVAYLADEANFRGYLFRRCVGDPVCRAALDAHLIDVAALFEEEDLAGYAAEQIQRIREVSRSDPMSPSSAGEARRAQARMRRWIARRAGDVAGQLGE